MVEYLVFVQNDEILAKLIENSSFYNRVCIKLIETLEGNHSSGFKAILVGFGARKIVIVDHDVELLMNLFSKTPFHCVVSTKSIPPNLGGNPLKPLKGSFICATYSTLFYIFRRPLNYLKYKKDYDPNVHV